MSEQEKYCIKKCKHHGETKFVFVSSKNGYRCVTCRTQAVSRKRRNLKIDLVKYKGGKCEKCGYDKCYAAMDFHHINPNEKDFGIASKGYTRSLESAKKEVDKCILLCSNCHRELHDEIAAQNIVVFKKNKRQSIKCLKCGLDTYNKKYCSNECSTESQRVVKRPTKEELIELLKKNTWVSVAKMFNVSDVAVRKWAKNYNINTNRKELRVVS